ncbi:MAG: site-specific integrase [Mucispirillum sp.]|nr:site-specific integrase [Mucispirillum sp.]
MKALLEACKQSRNEELYYIVLTALYTGMRYSNIVNMKKSNIKNNVYQLDGCETKSGKSQLIYLHQDLLNELNNNMQVNSINDCLFKTKRVKRSFKTALLKAGIENFRFHDLRRTFATTLLYNDVNIKTIQNMLGHSSIMMTERYLANDSKKELDAINKLCFI